METYITPERAAQLKAEAVAARRAARAPWQNAHADRVNREREARRVAKEYREKHRTKECPGCKKTLPLDAFTFGTGRVTSRCHPCRNADNRAAYHRKLGRKGTGTPRGTISPERRRQNAERIARFSAVLQGTAGTERISTEAGWESTTAELQRLWAQSGDKECVSCKATVPPSAMLPPGPANFYPGKCNRCVSEECRERHLRMFGCFPSAPLIPMRDGTATTVAEFARRVREREQG